MDLLTETALSTGLRRGDSNAMKLFYDSFAGLLTSVCARYISDDDEVKDIMQEALIKIYKSASSFKFRGKGSLSAWASRIVMNEALMALRKRRSVPIKAELPDIPDESPEEDMEGVPADVMMEMIRRLPDAYRTVFNLYVFEDMTHKEIAARLGIKEDSSASNLLRARRILQKEIQQYKKNR